MAEKKKKAENLQSRSPVVAVVGHIDHGKTTLLDFIRKTSVATGEAGGITQSVGAYEIEHDGKKITFIDTPGHEAFSSMRERGAWIADLGVLVVAADEGIKPQTTEAINILKQTETPFVVAITKIDTPNADVEKVKNGLLSADVRLEGLGGDVSWHEVSGKTGEGVDGLLSLIVLAGEVAELSFDPGARAYGFVLESKKDSRRGIIAYVVLKDGVLRLGEEIVTNSASGKVKILENFLGEKVKELIPSAPAIIGGFEDMPNAGEKFWAGIVDIKVVDVSGGDSKAVLEAADMIAEIAEESDGDEITSDGEEKIKAILKADSAGSLEALMQILGHKLEITNSSVGGISDNDVQFAKSTGSVILGLHVSSEKSTRRLAESQKVKIITSDIIYKLVEAVDLLEVAKEEAVEGGVLEVLAIFSGTQSKRTIGGKITKGSVRVGAQVQIARGEEVIGKGKVKNLQQNKEDIKEAATGNEVGLVVLTDTKIEKGDILNIS